MRLSTLSALGLACVLRLAGAVALDASQDAAAVLAELQNRSTAALEAAAAASPPSEGERRRCSLAQAGVRQDWEHLSKPQRKDYIRAVQCLLDAPARLTQYGWANKNRYDDFVAVHINMTLSIHGTANFLTWHRYFVHLWESALRNECGYRGYQPYWNWFKYQDDLSKSPVFDGSDTSLSGDGEFFLHNGSMAANRTIWLPSGKGGGCVKSGPFKNMTLNLGPLRPGMDGLKAVGSIADWNPRCLRRDLTMASTTRYLTTASLLNVTVGAASGSIAAFQDELQGARTGPDFQGLHGAGHYAMGAEGTDLYSSLNDPAFWLHHAMVDRLYWLWQALHPRRAATIAGGTVMRDPASPPGTLGDALDMRGLANPRPLRDLLDTLGGSPLCYIYV